MLIPDFTCIGAPTVEVSLWGCPPIDGTLFCWRLEVLMFDALLILPTSLVITIFSLACVPPRLPSVNVLDTIVP